jgi:hypothetical protein
MFGSSVGEMEGGEPGEFLISDYQFRPGGSMPPFSA